jgi:hypothetical protein
MGQTYNGHEEYTLELDGVGLHMEPSHNPDLSNIMSQLAGGK